MATVDECKKMIFTVGLKLGCSPRLISERLLSDIDKNDMLLGEIKIESLIEHSRVWMENGMPDYANGKTEPMKNERKG